MPGTQGAEAELIGEPGLPDAVASQLLQDLLDRAQHALASAAAEHCDPSDTMDSRAGASVMGSPFGCRSNTSAGSSLPGELIMRMIALAVAIVFCGLAYGADQPSEQHGLAADLLDAMDMESQVSKSYEAIKAMIPVQRKQMETFVPAGPKDEKSELRTERANEIMNKSTDKMMDMMAEEMKWDNVKGDYIDLYAETFSVTELKELVAFYRSPAGRALVAKQPELNRKLMEMSQKSMMRLMPKIIAISTEAFTESVKENATESPLPPVIEERRRPGESTP